MACNPSAEQTCILAGIEGVLAHSCTAALVKRATNWSAANGWNVACVEGQHSDTCALLYHIRHGLRNGF
eukprot:8961348-Alexandrium_andersonii.AAC.1